MITVALLTVGLVLLYAGAELLVKGAVSLAFRLGISPLVIGLTIVAFGTSAPELTVSVLAAFSGQGDIAAANVVGSNILNIALILGISALICPIHISRQLIRWDIPVMIGVSLLGCWVLADRQLSRLEGAILFTGIILYTAWAFRRTRFVPPVSSGEKTDLAVDDYRPMKLSLSVVCIAGGLILLVLGSKALVTGATQLARSMGLSETIIGLTIVSAGTSFPELATSVVAALRRQSDIAVGNVIGSNIFNILSILGLSSLLVPYATPGLTALDLAVMVGFAGVSLPFMWTRFTLSRTEGSLLIAGYAAYLMYLWPQ